jgi:niacin transporter
MRRTYIFQITAAAVLIAIGILIPMFAPRVVIGPASYTLASHVAIFIAMFISPYVAIAVVFGTTVGFFMGGFPLIIVLRAASHIAWALPGALYLSWVKVYNLSWIKLRAFSFIVAIVHGVTESLVVAFFYFGIGYPEDVGLLWVFGFVGLGTLIHSMIDFEIANVVRLGLQTQKSYRVLIGYNNKTP